MAMARSPRTGSPGKLAAAIASVNSLGAKLNTLQTAVNNLDATKASGASVARVQESLSPLMRDVTYLVQWTHARDKERGEVLAAVRRATQPPDLFTSLFGIPAGSNPRTERTDYHRSRCDEFPSPPQQREGASITISVLGGKIDSLTRRITTVYEMIENDRKRITDLETRLARVENRLNAGGPSL